MILNFQCIIVSNFAIHHPWVLLMFIMCVWDQSVRAVLLIPFSIEVFVNAFIGLVVGVSGGLDESWF